MKHLALALSCLLVTACVQAPPSASSSSPSAASSPSPSSRPASSTTSVGATAAPTTPAFALNPGVQAVKYEFKGIGGVYFNRALQQIDVADAVQATTGQDFYRMLKFDATGNFLSAEALAPSGMAAPDTVGGMAFDLTGRAYYGYHSGGAWQLDDLQGATVVQATDMPVNSIQRSGPSTVGSENNVIDVAAVWLDPTLNIPKDQLTNTGGKIDIGRKDATPGKPALTINQVPDPLWPTAIMAFEPDGSLLVCGPTQQGGLALKRIATDKTVTTLPVTLSSVPDQLLVGPDAIYMAQSEHSKPALVSRYTTSGQLQGTAPVMLSDGGYLFQVNGLALDAGGRLLVSGQGYDGAGVGIMGVYAFGTNP